MDVEWQAYILGHYGLPPGWRVLNRRPSCIRRQWRGIATCGYYGPKYVGSHNGYVSGK